MRLHRCCARDPSESDGCDSGPHVFSESEPSQLHSRHAFTHTRPPLDSGDTALDIVALDCEMIYTTGGMRVARVSVVDAAGKEVLDEFVRMDEGVEVMYVDFRFRHARAVHNSRSTAPTETSTLASPG